VHPIDAGCARAAIVTRFRLWRVRYNVEEDRTERSDVGKEPRVKLTGTSRIIVIRPPRIFDFPCKGQVSGVSCRADDAILLAATRTNGEKPMLPSLATGRSKSRASNVVRRGSVRAPRKSPRRVVTRAELSSGCRRSLCNFHIRGRRRQEPASRPRPELLAQV
jgi:hypothetical protein